jgi:hypothetical protein
MRLSNLQLLQTDNLVPKQKSIHHPATVTAVCTVSRTCGTLCGVKEEIAYPIFVCVRDVINIR